MQDLVHVDQILRDRLGGSVATDRDQRWRLVIEAANDAFIGMDADGRVTDWNRRASQIFGWSYDEADGQVLAELIIPEELREAHHEGLRRFLDTGKGRVLFQRLELPALRRDGSRFDAEVTIWPHREQQGWRFNAFLRDVTDRKRTRAFMELLQQVARTANETDDFDAAVRSALDGVCEVTGWPLGHAYIVDQDDPPRLLPTDLWHVAAGDFSEFQEITARKSFPSGEGLPGRVLASGTPTWIPDIERDDNFTRRRAMGDIAVRAGLGFPILSGDTVVAVLEFYSREPEPPDEPLLEVLGDVGTQLGRVYERVEDARRLEWANTRLENANRQKDHFVSVVAHELRSPLSAISGFADLLLEDDPSEEEQRTFYARIARHSERMQRLVRDLLTLSRLDLGKLRCEPEQVLLRDTVVDVVAGLTMGDVVDIDGQDAVSVWVDPDHLVRILTNLLTNAMTHGAAPAEVRWSASTAAVDLSVADRGPGIPDALRSELFQRFKVRDRSQGTGLGLAMSRELAELNDGSLEFDPDYDAGARFVLQLPRAD